MVLPTVSYFETSSSSTATRLPPSTLNSILSQALDLPIFSTPHNFLIIAIPITSPYFAIAVIVQKYLQSTTPHQPHTHAFTLCPFDCTSTPPARVLAVLNCLNHSPDLSTLILTITDYDPPATSPPTVTSLNILPLLSLSPPHSPPPSPLPPFTLPSPLLPSHLVFTSGTTAAPKPVVCSQSALHHYLISRTHVHSITLSSTLLLLSSLTFDPAFTDVLTALHCGCAIILPPPATSSLLNTAIPSLINALQVTHILTTPTILAALLQNTAPTFPTLTTLALGGELLTPSLVADLTAPLLLKNPALTILNTYGTTEACVYQTAGYPQPSTPFPSVRLKTDQDTSELLVGGRQIDETSCYYNDPQLTELKFIRDPEPPHARWYRTGDLATLHLGAAQLQLHGRLDSQIKHHGVRLELGETPARVCHHLPTLVNAAYQNQQNGQLILFVVPTPAVRAELGVEPDDEPSIISPATPLHTLLSTFLSQTCAPSTTPSLYVILPVPPVSQNGKTTLPTLATLPPPSTVTPPLTTSHPTPLSYHLTTATIQVLNLTPSQATLLTANTHLCTLGADSLTTTRILRQTYAAYHGIRDNRHLTGEYGRFEEEEWRIGELVGRTVGEWVEWVERKCGEKERGEAANAAPAPPTSTPAPPPPPSDDPFSSFMDALALSQSTVATAFLTTTTPPLLPVDPNQNAHAGRIGKTSSRSERKATWQQTPLHIASTLGSHAVLAALLPLAHRWLTPDATAAMPPHNLCLGGAVGDGSELERWHCLRMFLEKVPITVRDGNKQTLLHAAARSGKTVLLEKIIEMWMDGTDLGDKRPPSLDDRDRWQRTAVHWAILNSHLASLEILLRMGASPKPFWRGPKASKRTSAAIEEPMEMAERIHGNGAGNLFREMLLSAGTK